MASKNTEMVGARLPVGYLAKLGNISDWQGVTRTELLKNFIDDVEDGSVEIVDGHVVASGTTVESYGEYDYEVQDLISALKKRNYDVRRQLKSITNEVRSLDWG